MENRELKIELSCRGWLCNVIAFFEVVFVVPLHSAHLGALFYRLSRRLFCRVVKSTQAPLAVKRISLMWYILFYGSRATLAQ